MNADGKKLSEALALLEKGDWQAAHGIVQASDSEPAAWLHGIVHLIEGDQENARYWYKRAKREFSADVKAELGAAREALAGV